MMNNLKTTMLLAAMGGLCMAVGYLLAGPTGLTVGLLIGLGVCGASYWGSDRLAIRSANAVEVSAQQMPQYHAIMRDLCLRADMPMVTPCALDGWRFCYSRLRSCSSRR